MGLMVSPNITLQNRLIWNVIKMCVYLPLKTSYLPSTIRLRKCFPVTIPYYTVAMQGNSNVIDHQTCIRIFYDYLFAFCMIIRHAALMLYIV